MNNLATHKKERKICFYDVTCKCDQREVSLENLFDKHNEILGENYKDLIQRNLAIPFDDNRFYFLDKSERNNSHIYAGKFFNLKINDIPSMFNLSKGERKEIGLLEDDTLFDQAHFCYFSDRKMLVSEWDIRGANITRLSFYLSSFMHKIDGRVYHINMIPVLHPDIYGRMNSLNKITKIEVSASNPGIKYLTARDNSLNDEIIFDDFDNDTPVNFLIEFTAKRKQIEEAQGFLREKISRLEKLLKNNKVESLKVKGTDPETNKMVVLDLLNLRFIHTVNVDKLSVRSKYVVSNKMFDELEKAIHKYDSIFKR